MSEVTTLPRDKMCNSEAEQLIKLLRGQIRITVFAPHGWLQGAVFKVVLQSNKTLSKGSRLRLPVGVVA
eukprot:scaffold497_cov368-Prasinococcus_capsulatus_cf.AAC.12